MGIDSLNYIRIGKNGDILYGVSLKEQSGKKYANIRSLNGINLPYGGTNFTSDTQAVDAWFIKNMYFV
jgi:hypothetical protein